MSRGLPAVVLLVLVAALLQSTWVGWIQVVGEWPDLVLVLVILVALQGGHEAGAAAGVAGGLAMGWLTGVGGLAFLLTRGAVGLAAAELRLHWHRENLVVQVVAVLCGTVACELLFAALNPSVIAVPGWAWRVATRALLNVPLVPLVSVVVSRLPLTTESLGA